MKEKVVILFGGESVEHDISIITALQSMQFLKERDDLLAVYIDKSGIWWVGENFDKIETYKNFIRMKHKEQVSLELGTNILLKKRNGKFVPFVNVKAMLNCCHGRIGEDGCVQGLAKMCKIPQTSPNITESALCMDKVFLKDVLQNNNILTPAYVSFNMCTYDKEKSVREIVKKLGLPVIVKPANLGSSIGISVCKSEDEIDDAAQLALSFDKKIIVEKVVGNLREFNCAALFFHEQIFCSDVREVSNHGKIYTFEDKYLENGAKNNDVDKKLSTKIKKLTEKAYKLLDLQGIVRIDFLYDKQNKNLYINEINTIPGSLAFYLFRGIDAGELIESSIDQCIDANKDEKKFIKSFESDALKIYEEVGISGKK